MSDLVLNNMGVLSPRLGEVLLGVARGLSSKEIAQWLTISPNTVNAHIKSICLRLADIDHERHVRETALVAAFRLGILTFRDSAK